MNGVVKPSPDPALIALNIFGLGLELNSAGVGQI